MDKARENAKEIQQGVKHSLGNYPRATTVRIVDLECGGVMVAVRYHETDVAKLFLSKDGSRVLTAVFDSGGWISKTTAERIDSVLRFLNVEYRMHFSFKRDSSVRGVYGVPRQMGDTLYDQKFEIVTLWTEMDDPKGSGAVGLGRTEIPFEDGMTLKANAPGKGYRLTVPSKAKQKKLAKVAFSKFSDAQRQRRIENAEELAALDEAEPCFYCKSDDHASHNCEDRHR
jgi:hypothetical protein